MSPNRPVILVLGPSGRPLAERLAGPLAAEISAPAPAEVKDAVRALFAAGRPIIGICAAGILIRLLAPLLGDKSAEPAVIAVAEDGSAAVPLLGGHHGANDLARRIAELTQGQAAVTTASDVRFGVNLEAPAPGYVLANPQDHKSFTADLLKGAQVRHRGEAPFLANLPLNAEGALSILITEHAIPGTPRGLVYHPKTLVIGVGCERGAPAEELIALVMDTLAAEGLSPYAVAAVASLDLKADEAAIHALAAKLNVPARFFTAARLNEEAPRLANPSAAVMAEVGCPGVSEGAALACAGSEAELIRPKVKSARATCAIARAPQPVIAPPGRARGRLHVIGLGPGAPEWRSPAATSALLQSTDWVGYGLYLDLAADLSHGETQHRFPLGGEEARVIHALECAGEGKDVALICSGDAGIYAMAALVYEVLDPSAGAKVSDAARRVDVNVIPGISAFQAAAARAGALIGHDFCAISLSDLLTPWEVIEKRLHAAAQGDFVIAFYNPRSIKRDTHLARAKAILGPHRTADTPVVIASNLGRPEDSIRIVRFAEFDPEDVDMLTLVLIGSSQSRALKRDDGSTSAYTPRGYAKKRETSAT